MRDGCPFCEYDGPSEILSDFGDVIVFTPLNPVVSGHVLVVPREHVENFGSDPAVSARVAEVAATLCSVLGYSYNIITSKGRAATQTVNHLHLHVVPRFDGDGLALPWSDPE